MSSFKFQIQTPIIPVRSLNKPTKSNGLMNSHLKNLPNVRSNKTREQSFEKVVTENISR